MSATGSVQAELKTPIYRPPGSASDDSQFTTVSLEKKKKIPKRVLHFSDGILEEYSTDEEEDVPVQPPVDPRTLTWMPWMWYYVSACAFKAYSAADFCGEKLAWFFGITSPKYQSAIDEYHRRKEEEEREKAEEDAKHVSPEDIKILTNKEMVGEKLEKY